jgi:hypothetical protein
MSSMVDLVTVLPVWLELVLDVFDVNANASADWLRPVRVLRSLRIMRAYRLLHFIRTNYWRQTFITGLTIVSIVLGATGIVQAFEACPDDAVDDELCQDLTYPNALYYIIVSITTVGYGDISPRSVNGRTVMMGMLTITAVLVPQQVSKLLEVYGKVDVYGGKFRVVHAGPSHRHIVVTGEITPSGLGYFLREFFHEDLQNNCNSVVVLSPRRPGFRDLQILRHPQYEARVTWLMGSAMEDTDLERADIAHAASCFVMVDKVAEDSAQSDVLANLLIMSVLHMRGDRADGDEFRTFAQVRKAGARGWCAGLGAGAACCQRTLLRDCHRSPCSGAFLPALLPSCLPAPLPPFLPPFLRR